MQTTSEFMLLAFTAIFLPVAEPANILAVFPHIGKSHYFMFEPFVYKLAERGHKVTVITQFPNDKPPPNISFVNLRVPDETLLFNSFNLEQLEDMRMRYMRALGTVTLLRSIGLETCQKGLSHPNLQAFLKESHQFDLAIIEFFNTDCFACLAHVFKTPIIGISSSFSMPWHYDRFGTPDNPAYVNNHFLEQSVHKNFFQRTVNTLLTYATKIGYDLLFNSPADALVKEFIGNDIPPVREIVKNSSVYFVNSHFSLFQAQPLVPGIIELGGFHVRPPTGQIPKEIREEIEGSPNGVIFFSLGSTVRSATMPQNKLKIFQKALSKVPYKVLWKWEEDIMQGKPDNVVIGKWFPQNEILGHPNVKLFITHSGLMGTEEAVYHGVPMLMLPLFGDQPLNAASCADKGIGVIVDYYSITEESLSQGLNAVLHDKRYMEKAQLVSKIFMDRPLSLMDTAIYWTEYVIRFKGAPQLRSAVRDLTWYQEMLLDVFAFLFVTIATTLYILKRILCSLLFCGKSRQKKSKRD